MSRTPEIAPRQRPSIWRSKSDIELKACATNTSSPATSHGAPTPTKPTNTRETSSRAISAPRTPIPTGREQELVPGSPIIEFRIGTTAKTFFVHSDLLATRSPFFQQLFDTQASDAESSSISYPELDEFAFALFVRWLYGAKLHGPNDYNSMQHYLGMYILALRLRVERLANEVMNLVRVYYRESNMTAPAYRLRHIYENTEQPNMMKKFLVATAAFRALCEGAIGPEIVECVAVGGRLAVDFTNAVVDCHRSGMVDARRGPDCNWHEHKETRKCKRVIAEPWQGL